MQEAVAKERRARRRAEHAADEARDEKDAAVMAAQRKLDSTEASLAARELWVAQLELRLEKEKREVREMYCVCVCVCFLPITVCYLKNYYTLYVMTAYRQLDVLSIAT